jgi:hypothetical protein
MSDIKIDKEELSKLAERREKELANHRANMKKYRENPDVKAKHNEYMKAYRKKQQTKYAQLKDNVQPDIQIDIEDNERKAGKTDKVGKVEKADILLEIPDVENKPIDGIPRKDITIENRTTNVGIDEVVIPMWKKTGVKGVTTKTALNYYKTLANIHKIYIEDDSAILDIEIITRVLTGDCTKDDETYIICNLSYLKGSKLIDFIQFMKKKYDNPNTLKGYLNPFVVISSYIEYFKDTYQVLSKIIIGLNKIYEDHRDDNEITEEDSSKLIDYSPDKIVAVINTIPDITDKLIFALYTLIPPRRLEYASVIITDNKDIDSLNNANYLIIDAKNTKKTTFVFHEYKTKKTFDKQILSELPNNLLSIIYSYLTFHKKDVGDNLFLNSLGDPLKNNSFGDRITKLFTKVNKIHITLRYIRMSYSTYMNSLGLTNNQIKKRADIMAHSVKTNSRYKKVVVKK